MTKLLIVVVLLIHGLIHTLGFAKAFGLADLPQLSPSISRPWGVAWGACALPLLAAAAARLANAPWWWMLAGPGLITSQVIILAFWTDARFGTLANVALILPVVIAFGSWRFASRSEAEIDRLAASAPDTLTAVVGDREIAALPPVVATWMKRSGVVGLPAARTARVSQRGQMQTAPGAKWMSFAARQWTVLDPPAFLWLADVDGPFGIDLAGRDRYFDGKGSMRIELLSLIPIVDKEGPNLDQGALVRFLAEIMWYPSGALAPYIRWEAIDAQSARAIMRYGDIEADGVFRFTPDGDVLSFQAPRYRDGKLEDWLIDNDPTSFQQLDGVRVPTRTSIAWREGQTSEPWTWLRLEVVSLERNPSTTHW